MNESTYSIRKCSLGDLDMLVEMRLEFLAESGHFKTGDDITEIRNELRSFIKAHLNKDLYMWLAEADSRTVATGTVSIWDKLPTSIGGNSSKIAYISNMYTRPEYRKKGIASAVVKSILDTLHREDIPRVMLHAMEDGKRVYRNSGFETNDSIMEMKLA